MALEVRIENDSGRNFSESKIVWIFLDTTFLQKRTGALLFSGERN